MESSKVAIAALLFIVLIIGVNFVMYGLVRGWTRPNNKNIPETLSKSLNTSMQKKDNSVDELRRKMEELEKGKKEDAGESE